MNSSCNSGLNSGLPNGFRYDRDMWGRGFNCAVVKKDNLIELDTSKEKEEPQIFNEKVFEKDQIDEAPLVMPKANIIDSILEGLKREIEKKFKRNQKDGKRNGCARFYT